MQKEVAVMHACQETTEGGIGGSESQVGEAFIPNDMATARAYFDLDMYKANSIEFKVSSYTKHPAITVGVKKATGIEGDWTIFTGWKLEYLGKTAPTAISKVNNDSQAAAISTAYFTVNGARVAAPQKGINIVKKTLSDGTVKVQKVLVK
jgi:hypothetical protein